MKIRKVHLKRPPLPVGSAWLLATAVLTAAFCFPAIAVGSDDCCDISYCGPARPQDQVWLISSRHLGCPSGSDASGPDLRYSVYDRQNGWIKTDADAFDEMNGRFGITGFYMHGYRNDAATAMRMGWAAYYAIVQRAEPTGIDVEPIRWVIWSWPSDQTGRILRDAKQKAQRTDAEGYYLARVISRLDERENVSLMGWSLGARIATGALHLLGGGSLGRLSLDGAPTTSKRRVRAVLMGASLHDYWLDRGAYHGRAVSQLDRMLLLNNSCDSALRRYWRISRCERPEALGFTGLPDPSRLGQAARRIEQVDVCCTIGREHDSTHYLCSEALMRKARRYVLWAEP